MTTQNMFYAQSNSLKLTAVLASKEMQGVVKRCVQSSASKHCKTQYSERASHRRHDSSGLALAMLLLAVTFVPAGTSTDAAASVARGVGHGNGKGDGDSAGNGRQASIPTGSGPSPDADGAQHLGSGEASGMDGQPTAGVGHGNGKGDGASAGNGRQASIPTGAGSISSTLQQGQRGKSRSMQTALEVSKNALMDLALQKAKCPADKQTLCPPSILSRKAGTCAEALFDCFVGEDGALNTTLQTEYKDFKTKACSEPGEKYCDQEGICLGRGASCASANQCRGDKSFRCLSWACAADAASCAGVVVERTSCPIGHQRCPDGICYAGSDGAKQCVKTGMQWEGCPPGKMVCPNGKRGTCGDSVQDCNTKVGCVAPLVKCGFKRDPSTGQPLRDKRSGNPTANCVAKCAIGIDRRPAATIKALNPRREASLEAKTAEGKTAMTLKIRPGSFKVAGQDKDVNFSIAAVPDSLLQHGSFSGAFTSGALLASLIQIEPSEEMEIIGGIELDIPILDAAAQEDPETCAALLASTEMFSVSDVTNITEAPVSMGTCRPGRLESCSCAVNISHFSTYAVVEAMSLVSGNSTDATDANSTLRNLSRWPCRQGFEANMSHEHESIVGSQTSNTAADFTFTPNGDGDTNADVTDDIDSFREEDVIIRFLTTIPAQPGCLFDAGGEGTGVFVGIVDDSNVFSGTYGMTFRFIAFKGDYTEPGTAIIVIPLPDPRLPQDGSMHEIVLTVKVEQRLIELTVDGMLIASAQAPAGDQKWAASGTACIGVGCGKTAAGGTMDPWTGVFGGPVEFWQSSDPFEGYSAYASAQSENLVITRQNKCVPCLPGTFKASNGTAGCMPCPTGTFAPANSSIGCLKCGAGRFSTAIGATSISTCKACPSGTYSASVEGSSGCIACPPNSDSLPGAASLTDCLCVEGFTLTNSSSSSTLSCRACPPGTFKASNGTAACSLCPQGKYSTTSANVAELDCLLCQAGKYSLATAATEPASCQNCPPNSYSRPGASSPNNCTCNVGFTGNISFELIQSARNVNAGITGGSSLWNASLSCRNHSHSDCRRPVNVTVGNHSSHFYTIQESWAPFRVERIAGAVQDTFSVEVLGSCAACPPGRFKASSGWAACSLCPPGKYSVTSGNVAELDCTPCPSGTYSSSSGANTRDLCWQCARHSTSPPGSISPMDCQCNAGYTSAADAGYSSVGPSCSNSTNNDGIIGCNGSSNGSSIGCNRSFVESASAFSTTTCRACRAGTFKDIVGSAECRLCPAGTFSNECGNTKESDCSVCPLYSFSRPGASSSSGCTCNRGYTGPDGGACTPCVAGTFKGGDGSGACTGCPAGKISTSSAQSSESTCLDCHAGTFSDALAATTCKLCPAGTYSIATGSTSPDSCTDCPSGKYAATTGNAVEDECIRCPAGTFSETSGNAAEGDCLPCGVGTYSTATGSSSPNTCTNCPAGTFSDMTGSAAVSNCKACIPGKYALPFTVSNTSYGASSCLDCAVGTYSNTTGAENATFCILCQAQHWGFEHGLR